MVRRVHVLLMAGVSLIACGGGVDTTSPPTPEPSVASPAPPPDIVTDSSVVTSTTHASPADSSPATIDSLTILRAGGLGLMNFGTQAGQALDGLVGILGPPTVDEVIQPGAECVEGSSWEDCLSANNLLEQGRIVRWADRGLSVAFTDAEWSGGDLQPTPLQFSSWRAVRPAVGKAVTTVEDIGPGATVGDLRANYSDLHWGFNEGVWDSVGFGVTAGDDCTECFDSAIWSKLDYDLDQDGFEIAYTRAFQTALNAQGADLAVDGEIGPRTQMAWEQFCDAHDLSCGPDWPGLPWNITEGQREALAFPPSDVTIAAMVSSQ